MIFKWPMKNKWAASPVTLLESAGKPAPGAKDKGPPNPLEPLDASELRLKVDRESLSFKTTAELQPSEALLGQDRALAAVEFGGGVKAADFNVLVVGAVGTGKRTAVAAQLKKIAAQRPAPTDWVYVTNFSDESRPLALGLPTGRGKKLARGLREAVEDLVATLPAVFEGSAYQARRRAVDEDLRSGEDAALDALMRRAAQQNVAVLRTPLGFAVAPMHESRVVKPDVFRQLPASMRREVEARVGEIEKELAATLARLPISNKRTRKLIADLDAEFATAPVEAALDEVSAEFADVPEVARFLADVERDLVQRAASLIATLDTRAPAPRLAQVPREWRRYLVNVVTEHESDAHAPIVEDPNPTLAGLTGHLDFRTESSGLDTDALMIRSGTLHRANGGYLVLEVDAILADMAAWNALKRALKAQQIVVEGARPAGLSRSLDPMPIPLDVKVVLIGSREAVARLRESDSDVGRLFKVQVEFEDTVKRTEATEQAYARLVASVADKHAFLPVEAEAVACLIEDAGRLAEDREKLSIEIGRIADVLREADYTARSAERTSINASEVTRAISAPTHRTDRARERTREMLERGIILMDTDGAKIGQVNALATVDSGSVSYGRPARITARAHLGQGRVTDIERETQLGGALHSKGVMILWGYLAGRFAQDYPLALAASLVFEQSYDTVDGDSASAAELLALLSCLAGVPLRQDLAVTGSLNQLGEIQSIGGVNQKIEGFFDLCRARGLTGTQGVIIPRANVQHLMLREDVLEAAERKHFSVYAVSHVDEAIEILTGMTAGVLNKDGSLPKDSVNGRVDAKLRGFAERARTFAIGKGSIATGSKS